MEKQTKDSAATADLNGRQLDQISRVITAKTGLVFPKSREAELRHCLLECFRASTDSRSAEVYLQKLESDSLSKRDMRRLIARLTVGETYFFRNRAQFDLIRYNILPHLVHRRARTTRSLRLWSAGCSTGEEAYSLAILLHEAIPQPEKWNVFLLATDISEDAIRQAEKGEFREWSFRDVDPQVKERYFAKTGDVYKIHPDIRRMVTFRCLNLVEDTYPLVTTGTNFMDIILCRNVMIYFKGSLNTSITRRFYLSLNNDGCLIIGHAEHTEHIFRGFHKEFAPGAVVYRKKEAWSDLERGLRLRFRGSGKLPGNVVPSVSSAAAGQESRRPAPTVMRRETAIFEEGVSAFTQGQNKQAMAKFREVVDLSPRNHRACYMLALIEANQGHLRKAEDYCHMAIAGYPLSLEAHYLMANVAREEGERGKELDYLKKTIYINPDFVLGHYQLGSYYLHEGNNVLARKFFRNALKLLDKWNEKDYIEGTEGMAVGQLRENIGRSLAEIGSNAGPPLEDER